MHGLQEPELLDNQEQEEKPGPAGAEKVLPVMPAPYGAQGSQIDEGSRSKVRGGAFQLFDCQLSTGFQGASDQRLICRSPKPVMGVRVPPPLPENRRQKAPGKRGEQGAKLRGETGHPKQRVGPRMADEITLQKNYLKVVRDYFDDVRTEMKRVTWPGKQEVYGTTVMVILSTFLFACYFALCDYVFRSLVQRALDLFLRRR
jgi:preprotein translocase subunit SecE